MREGIISQEEKFMEGVIICPYPFLLLLFFENRRLEEEKRSREEISLCP